MCSTLLTPLHDCRISVAFFVVLHGDNTALCWVRCRRYTSNVQRHCHMEEAERSLTRGMSTLSARDRCGSEDMYALYALHALYGTQEG